MCIVMQKYKKTWVEVAFKFVSHRPAVAFHSPCWWEQRARRSSGAVPRWPVGDHL